MNAMASPVRTPAATLRPAVAAAAVALLAVGILRAESALQLVAFLLVTLAAAAPMLVWLRRGALGVPVFPLIALAHIAYFALPIVSSNENLAAYDDVELLRAAATVASMLVLATLAWRFAARGARPADTSMPDAAGQRGVVRLVAAGLAMGLAFHVGSMVGAFGWLGAAFGLARALLLTFCTIACFLAGVSVAQGIVRGPGILAIGVVMALLVLLAWSSLFLVTGVVYALAALFGYVIVRRRVPWVFLCVIAAAVVILHSGKAEMRAKYWFEDANYGQAAALTAAPGLFVEWAVAGVVAVAQGQVAGGALERASLLQMLLLTQSRAPDLVEFLEGETYAHLPSILVPRVFDPDKPSSQVAMDLLNIHYGLLTVEGAAVTAIGWGLLAEAYANFGYWGVVAIALFLGLLCGGIEAWASGKPLISLPVLLNVGAMMALMNMELDFIQLFLVLLHALAAVLLFFAVYGWFVRRPARRARGPAH